jgi:hypothetical protein
MRVFDEASGIEMRRNDEVWKEGKRLRLRSAAAAIELRLTG